MNLFLFTVSLWGLIVSAVGRDCKEPINLRSIIPRTRVPAWQRNEDELCVFCYHGSPKDLSNIFITCTLQIQISDEEFQLYVGSNETDVREKYTHSKGSWFQLFPWKATTIEMKPFEKSCLGVASKSSYHTHFSIRRMDLWRVAYVILATALFFNAKRICSSVFLYYTTGITLGVIGFLIILVYILSRYMPKKPLALTVILGGWSLILYMMQWMWDNMMELLMEYRFYFYMYILGTGVLSFGVLYRFEPMTHSRSRDLLRWSLQGFGLFMVLWSSHIVEATLAYDILLLLVYNFPPKWTEAIKLFWLKKYPPERYLLTEDEYIQEGHEETKRSLEELRRFCASPDCNAWKVVSRLKSPQRFAEFVGGSPHLTDTEVLEHSLWEDPYMDNEYDQEMDQHLFREYDESDEELVPNGR